MNFIYRLLSLLQMKMVEPKPYGWFHIMWIVLSAIMVIVLYKKNSEKSLKRVLGVYGVVALILEILKQISWSFDYNDGNIIWEYSWYSAPFQLCTTPMYVSLICLFLKDSHIRKALLSYVAYVTILGSIATAIMPDSCFVRDTLVNIHTMWLHCGSLVVSLYLIMNNFVGTSFKYYASAIIMFVLFADIANLLNIIVYNSGILGDATFNMFYISPYFVSSLPLFDYIQEHTPYILYLLIYVSVMTLGSYMVYNITRLMKKRTNN